MKQKGIIFVCLGNICRSPMAETIFNSIINKNSRKNDFIVDSAGLLDYHKGNEADRRMRAHAAKHGYEITHLSRPIVREDFENFDLIISMDNAVHQSLLQMAKTDEERIKIKKMTDYRIELNAQEIPDPYYGGAEGFENVISLLEDSCIGLYRELTK